VGAWLRISVLAWYHIHTPPFYTWSFSVFKTETLETLMFRKTWIRAHLQECMVLRQTAGMWLCVGVLVMCPLLEQEFGKGWQEGGWSCVCVGEDSVPRSPNRLVSGRAHGSAEYQCEEAVQLIPVLFAPILNILLKWNSTTFAYHVYLINNASLLTFSPPCACEMPASA